MKRTEPIKTATSAIADPRPSAKSNGRTAVAPEPVSADLSVILASLQTMRDGDFSVRLPGYWTGLAGKIADTFNDIVAANQQMAQGIEARRTSGRQRRQNARAHAVPSCRRRLGRDGSLGQYAGRGPAAADDGSDARDRRRRARAI